MKATVTTAKEQGPRSYQEDYYVHLQIKDDGVSVGDLLAVMDGHISRTVAEFCALNIPAFFTFLGPDRTEQALENLVKKLNEETAHLNSGSTISIALITYKPLKVSVAVLGDSPVLVHDKKRTLHTSPEHNVRSNPKERQAAEARGGYVAGGYVYTDPLSINGLQMTRALGNAYLGKVLLREPEVYTVLNPQWILVASDGVFDPGHADTKRLIGELKSYAEKHANAEEIMAWAGRRGLHDNATALVWSV